MGLTSACHEYSLAPLLLQPSTQGSHCCEKQKQPARDKGQTINMTDNCHQAQLPSVLNKQGWSSTQQKNSTHRTPQKTYHVNSIPNLSALLSKLFIGTDVNVPGPLPPCLLNPRINSLLFIHLFNKYILDTTLWPALWQILRIGTMVNKSNIALALKREENTHKDFKTNTTLSNKLPFDPIFQVRKL